VTPERWRQIESVFNEAADLPEDQRPAFLDSSCAGDSELRNEVDGLLAASSPDLLDSAINASTDDMVMQASDDAMVGKRLGHYRIDALIGRGGMGAVYRAVRDDDEFRQQVAIKVVPRLLASPEAVGRFRSERQILANLVHPNIARLLDGGSEDGIPFLVMEYVEGVPLTEYLAGRNLSIAQQLVLMRSICDAVQYAHQNLIVHRDLKPGNILVTAEGNVKLLDFGVAKLLDPGSSGATQTSAMMLTPDYASPEQIRGDAVTTASDVYSLGVVLYEVLTGSKPYELTSTNPIEIQRMVCESEPVAPRTQMRQIDSDLDNIVLMAMRKDPSRRYGSADQLSADIRRYLEGRPVLARRDSFAYRAGKFIQRNRWPLGAAALTSCLLIAATVTAVREAREAQHRFDQLRSFARTVLVDLDAQLRDVPGTVKARQVLIAEVDGFLKKAVAENSSDDAGLAAELATTYLRMGEMQGVTPAALASFESGRKLLENKPKLSSADILVLARLCERIGMTLAEMGRTPAAIENLSRTASLADSVRSTSVEAPLMKARADWRLARLYRIEYHLDEAEQHGRMAVAASQALMSQGQSGKEVEELFSGSRLVLGGVLKRQGKWQESLALYEQILADSKVRVQREPQSVVLQRELARNYQIVADMLNVLPERRAEVPAHVRDSVRILDRLAALDPMDDAMQGELGQYLSTAGEFLERPEDYAESMAYLHRSLEVFGKLLRKEPESGVYVLYHALVEADIGRKLGEHGSHAEALQWMERGRAELVKLVARDRENLTHRFELIKVQRWIVANLARLKREKEAVALAEEMIAETREIAPRAAFMARELPRAYATLGKAYRTLGKPAEAKTWYAKALEEWTVVKKGRPASPDEKAEIDEARALSQ